MSKPVLEAAILIERHGDNRLTIEPSISDTADDWVEALVSTVMQGVMDQLDGMTEAAKAENKQAWQTIATKDATKH